MKTKIFVYGTLLRPDIRERVSGSVGSLKPATLWGYRKEGLNIVKDKKEKVNGGIIEVDENGFNRINDYEGLGYLYKIIKVKPAGYETVIAYQKI
jgi:gamma-glutamylcyclotransferase (GGCT)/AIG2-like uncharacterized protein YtfP